MWKGTKVIVRHAWAETLAHVTNPVNAWGDTKRASMAKREAGDKYYALDDLPAAQAAMATGWQPGRDRIAENVGAAIAGVRAERIPTYRLDVAGERPNVPLAVAGDPRCMFRRRPEAPRSRPIVSVLMSIGAAWHVHADCLARRGAAVLAWCDALEAAGWTTEVEVYWYTKSGAATLDYRCVIKPAGERFDADRMSFAMVCPDMLRRAAFTVLEACPDLRDSHHATYGQSTSLPDAEVSGRVHLGRVDKGDPWNTVASAVANVRAAIMSARAEVLA